MTQAQVEPAQTQVDPMSGNWVKVAEHSLDYLNGPSPDVEGMTRLDALKAFYTELGAQAVSISMNGHNSPEANAWNSENTRLGGPKGDYVYSVTALMPPDSEGT